MSTYKELIEGGHYSGTTEPREKRICDSCIHSVSITTLDDKGDQIYKKIYCKNIFQVVFEEMKRTIKANEKTYRTNDKLMETTYISSTQLFNECSGFQKQDKPLVEIKAEIDNELNNEIDIFLDKQGA